MTDQRVQKDAKEEDGGRILIGQSTGKDIFQLFLKNKRILTYPYSNDESVISMTYVSTSRKLIVANTHSIEISDLDRQEGKIMLNVISLRSIAVDEKKRVIFLSYNKKIMKTNLDFDSIKLLSNKDDVASQMAVHSERQTLYACTIKNLVSYSYDGKHRRTMTRGSSVTAVAVDPVQNYLFFSNNKNLLQMNINTKKVKSIPLIRILTLLYYEGGLYIVTYNGNLSLFKNQRLLYITKINTTSQISMCGVP